MAGKLLEEFLIFCEAYLEDSKGGKEVEKLIKKRFHCCDDKFKNSSEFSRLIVSTRTKIDDDKKRFFVHIKDFVTELKAYGRDSSEREGKSKSNSKSKKRSRESSPSEDSEGARKKANLGTEKANDSVANVCTAIVSESKPEGSPCSHEVTSTCSPAVSPVRKLKADSGTGVPIPDESCKAIDFSSSEVTKVDNSDIDDVPASISCENNIDKCLVKEENEAHSSLQAVVLGNLNLVPKRVTLQPAKSETVSASFSDQHKTNHTSKPQAKPSNMSNSKDNLDNASTSFLGERKKVANDKHIHRLEKLLAKLRNEIEKVKARELSLDDLGDEDSSYIYEDRLQKKFVKVWDKLCELKGRRKTTGRPTEQRFTYEGTRYPEINKKIERFINKKKMFPDYHDIRDIIIKVNKRKELNMSSRMVEMIARDTFTDVGNQLQQRRKEDFLATFGCRLTDSVNPHKEDPALRDPDLKEKLESNRVTAKQNLETVISKFAHEQFSRGEELDDVANQSGEEKRETSTSPTNEEEEEPEEEVCVPELDEVLSDQMSEADEYDGCVEVKDEDDNCDYYDDDDDDVIEISTDEEEDDAQSDDDVDGDPSLPRTFSSVLENMQMQNQSEDSQDVAEVIHDSADDNYVPGVDDGGDEPVQITDDCVYMDVADDSDVPEISEVSPATADNTESDSEASESSSSNFQAPFTSPKRSIRSKLSIRTPQKSLIRKVLGLKSPGKSPKVLKFPVRRPVQRIEDESDSCSSDVEISSSVPSNQTRCKTPENNCQDQNIVEMRSSSQSSDDVIAITPESTSFPLDDPVISSSTGDPSKGHNSFSDDDVIILD